MANHSLCQHRASARKEEKKDVMSQHLENGYFRLLNNYNILPKILQKMAEMVIYYIVKLWIWRMDPCNLVVQVQLAQ